MTPAPFLDQPPAKRWAFCPYCSTSYPSGSRHTCTPAAFMRWTSIVNTLAATFVTACVVVLLLLAADALHWPPWRRS